MTTRKCLLFLNLYEVFLFSIQNERKLVTLVLWRMCRVDVAVAVVVTMSIRCAVFLCGTKSFYFSCLFQFFPFELRIINQFYRNEIITNTLPLCYFCQQSHWNVACKSMFYCLFRCVDGDWRLASHRKYRTLFYCVETQFNANRLTNVLRCN